MDFNDNESPQFDFGDPRELYKLSGNKDLLDESELIDMTDPNSHPDWAKEINSKYGIFEQPKPKLLAGNISPDGDVTPNVPKIKDIPKLYQQLVDLKTNRQPASKPPVEEVSTPTPSPTPKPMPTPGDPFKSPRFRDDVNKQMEEDLLQVAKEGDFLIGNKLIDRSANVLDPNYKSPTNPLGFTFKDLFNKFAPGDNLPPDKTVKAAPELYPVAAPELGEKATININSPMVKGIIPEKDLEKAKELFPEGKFKAPKEDSLEEDSPSNLQKQMGNLKLLQLLMEGSSELGAGISGARSGYNVKPIKTSLFDDLSKQAEEDWTRRVKFQPLDPSSKRSGAMRELVKEQAKKIDSNANLSLYDNMSEDQLKEAMNRLEKIEAIQERGEQRKDEMKIRSESNNIQRGLLKLEEKRMHDNIIENRVTGKVLADTKDEVSRIQGADRAQAFIDGIRQNKLIASSNVRNLLTREVAQLAMPAGLRASVSAQQATEINTLYGKIQDTVGKIVGHPQDSIPEGYLNQLETEISMIKQKYIMGLQQKGRAMENMYSDPVAKQAIRNRISSFVPYENKNSYSSPQFELGPDEAIQVHPKTGKKYIVNKKTKQVIRQVD